MTSTNTTSQSIAIIGGGAAGCFAAIELRRRLPHARISLFEAGTRLLAKVAITGGGRCNLTNSFAAINNTEVAYPRGARLMKRLLREFSETDAYDWWEAHGVRLLTQDDNCVFPVSQDAMQVVNTLISLLHQARIEVHLRHRVQRIEKDDDSLFHLHFGAVGEQHQPVREATAQQVLVATGGSPKASLLNFLSPLNQEIVEPVPSLFSFCIEHKPLTALMGIVTNDVITAIPGTKLRADGPLLITHWGLSGPAILKLSSYGARHLAECNYHTRVLINWMGANEEQVVEWLAQTAGKHPQKQVGSIYPEKLNSRLWTYLLQQAGVQPTMRYADLGTKWQRRLAATLTADVYDIAGKNRHRDEFVTCGGVALTQLQSTTLESRTCPGLFFAGEVTDVDAITGGFNLQAAWTMAWVAAKGMASQTNS